MSRRILFYILPLIAFAGVGVGLVIFNNADDDTLPNRFTESTAFAFDYPENWEFRIPVANFLLLAPLPVLDQQEAGPSFTVQRVTRFEAGGETPEDALQAYLERNPLSDDNPGEWEIVTDMTATTFDGRPAVQVELSGSDTTERADQRVQITTTLAESGMVYFLTISAPETLWDNFADTLTAILDSVTITE